MREKKGHRADAARNHGDKKRATEFYFSLWPSPFLCVSARRPLCVPNLSLNLEYPAKERI